LPHFLGLEFTDLLAAQGSDGGGKEVPCTAIFLEIPQSNCKELKRRAKSKENEDKDERKNEREKKKGMKEKKRMKE